ncbi:type VI secretion system protein TssA [Glaciecola sp. 1036]|uniref:type VI secretion system protein TssA n=1 Tax=Alteromonadaceae TaxID=72275 RepID=UPI003CFCDA3C
MDYTEKLLEPISEDSPCGENLEDDAAFQNFFFMAQGTPERFDGSNTLAAEPPDWRQVEKEAAVFLQQTKDLKLISVYSQSLLNTKGLIAFSQCVKAIADLVSDYWQDIYPLLDEDDGDPLERVAGLSFLSTPFITTPLKSMSLASAKGAGNITLADIEAAENDSEDAKFSLSQIKGVFGELNSDEVQLFYDALAYSLESLQQINQCFIDNSGYEYALDFSALESVLHRLKASLEKYAQMDSEALDDISSDDDQYVETEDAEKQSQRDSESQNVGMKGKTEGGQVPNQIHSRADVEWCLGLINAYYANYEPSSPIPVLVNRALKLVHKDFMAIVQDIYPDALATVQSLAGMSDEETEKDDDW